MGSFCFDEAGGKAFNKYTAPSTARDPDCVLGEDVHDDPYVEAPELAVNSISSELIAMISSSFQMTWMDKTQIFNHCPKSGRRLPLLIFHISDSNKVTT